jgi:hypothetical protein
VPAAASSESSITEPRMAATMTSSASAVSVSIGQTRVADDSQHKSGPAANVSISKADDKANKSSPELPLDSSSTIRWQNKCALLQTELEDAQACTELALREIKTIREAMRNAMHRAASAHFTEMTELREAHARELASVKSQKR